MDYGHDDDEEEEVEMPTESKISKTLSERTTKIVIILVLVMLFILPVFMSRAEPSVSCDPLPSLTAGVSPFHAEVSFRGDITRPWVGRQRDDCNN